MIAEAPDLVELIQSFSNVFWKLHVIEKEDMEDIAGHIENQIVMARLTGSDPAESHDPGLFISLFLSTQLRSLYVYNMKMTPRFNCWLECQRHIRVLDLPHNNYWFGDQPAIAVPELQQLSAPPLATVKILENSPVLAIDARIVSDGGIRKFAKLLHIHSENIRKIKIDVIYGPPSVSDARERQILYRTYPERVKTLTQKLNALRNITKITKQKKTQSQLRKSGKALKL
ncbi:hypothetical protein FRB96_009020 [Tulasnella sp. 330]